MRGYAEPPQTISFGRCSFARREHVVVVDEVRLPRDAVVDDVVEPPREVHLEAVGQVAAVRQLEREDRVARLQDGEVDGHVRLRTRVRLDVRVLGAEERLRAVDRELLDLVDDLAAAVVATPGIPLGVLVRRDAADRLEHRRPREVLGRDELDLAALALELLLEERRDLGIDVGEPCGAEILERQRRRSPSRGMLLRDPCESLRRRHGTFAEHAGLGPGEVDHGRRRARKLAAVESGARRLRGSPSTHRRGDADPAPPCRFALVAAIDADTRQHLGGRAGDYGDAHADRVRPAHR